MREDASQALPDSQGSYRRLGHPVKWKRKMGSAVAYRSCNGWTSGGDSLKISGAGCAPLRCMRLYNLMPT